MKMHSINMTSSKPYLIRGLYEWIADNNMTPYIAVDINVDNIKVPVQYAQDGKIILNISHTAAAKLQIDNDYITFSARFSGTAMNVVVPTFAVLGIYAKETGAGMVFEGEDSSNPPSPPPPPSIPFSGSAGKPNIKLVKS